MINTAPAVVVGAELNGLGVVRSLARGTIPAIVLDTTRRRAGMWSRHSRAMVVDKLDGRALVDNLLKLQRELDGRPVLMLTDAQSVSTVSEHRDELHIAYRFNLPSRETVDMLADDARFFAFAERHDLPVPKSIVLRQGATLSRLKSLPFPVVIKPTGGQNFPAEIQNLRHPIFTLKDAETLSARALDIVNEIIVQEWIGGPESNVCFSLFCLGHKPENFKVFTGRKLASSAARPGRPGLCLPAPEAMEALEPLIAKYLDVTEFQGLGSLTFKWDTRQRRYVIIGRAVGYTEWHAEIATLSGVNLALAAYRDEVGMTPLAAAPIDRMVAWQESALLQTELSMSSPGTVMFDGYWRIADPLPGLFFYANTGLEWVNRHVLEPIIGRLIPPDAHVAIERTYQSLVKTIIRRGKASTP